PAAPPPEAGRSRGRIPMERPRESARSRRSRAPKPPGRARPQTTLPPRMHALELGLYVFGVIFVAELPDKTALASLVLATRHRALPVFFGSALALTVQS